jgi:hypothetical protein
VSLGTDVRSLPALRALGYRSPFHVGPVLDQHRAEGQGDQPVGAARRTTDQDPMV